MQGAIFDMDGTILDSMPVWDTAAADYLATIGIQAEPGLHDRIKHLSMADAARYFQEVYHAPKKTILKRVSFLF